VTPCMGHFVEKEAREGMQGGVRQTRHQGHLCLTVLPRRGGADGVDELVQRQQGVHVVSADTQLNQLQLPAQRGNVL
jgi:hypothetical protein